MADFITLRYSPWSERARFALDHHRVRYRLVPYEPGLGEVALRLRTRRWLAPATVPVFLDGPIRLFDSFAIAEHADRVGEGDTLFPEEHRAAIVRWNAASERALRSARKRSFERLLEDDDGLADQLRTVAPSALRPRLVPVARQAVRFMQSKYGSDAIDRDEVVRELEELRAALARSGGEYLLGRLSYADVTMAAAIHLVEPLGEPFVVLPPHARRMFRDDALRARFPDLVAWRNELYRRHGPPRRGSVTERDTTP